MGTAGDLLFVVSAAFALGGAVATVTFANPLRAAVSLLIHIIALAGLFLTLQAHLLAALQLLVYAGAVVVLFIFVIMLIGPSATAPADSRGTTLRAVSLALMAIVTGAVAFSVVDVGAEWVRIPPCPPEAGAECGQFGGVEALGGAIYRDGLVPFELAGVLLLVAIIGAVAGSRGRSAAEVRKHLEEKRAREAEEAARREEERRLSAEVAAHGGH